MTDTVNPLSANGAAALGEAQHPAYNWFQDDVKQLLDQEGRLEGVTSPRLIWHEWAPGVIRTIDRRFAVVRVFVPGQKGPKEYFVLLQEDPASTRAYGPDDLGFIRTAKVGLFYALQEAEMLARQLDADPALFHVPDDYADQLSEFFWPISDGTDRGALVVRTDEDGSILVEVVGMGFTDSIDRTAPGVYAAIDITDLVSKPKRDKGFTLRRAIKRALTYAAAPMGAEDVVNELDTIIRDVQPIVDWPADEAVRPVARWILTNLARTGWAIQASPTTFARNAGQPDYLTQAIHVVLAASKNAVSLDGIVGQVQAGLSTSDSYPGRAEVTAALNAMIERKLVLRASPDMYVNTREHLPEPPVEPFGWTEPPVLQQKPGESTDDDSKADLRQILLAAITARPGMTASDLVASADQEMPNSPFNTVPGVLKALEEPLTKGLVVRTRGGRYFNSVDAAGLKDAAGPKAQADGK